MTVLRYLLADKDHPQLEEAMRLALTDGGALDALLDGGDRGIALRRPGKPAD